MVDGRRCGEIDDADGGRAVSEAIQLAADSIRRGELVGMPTETVYGIAADAFNPSAIERTFALKGRPSDNPLIVHLASADDWSRVATEFNDWAQRLAAAFWPGPLTIVLPKHPNVPLEATAGLGTVAARVPGHSIARALIEAAGTPLTAPSANRFTMLSPTRADDIDPAIRAGLAFVLDGGPSEVGIESTVIDVTGTEPRLLRPGHVTRLQTEAVLGVPVLLGGDGRTRSPGMYPRHYAPRTPVRLVEKLASGQPGITFGAATTHQIGAPSEPNAYARDLYAALADLDRQGFAEICVEIVPEGDAWEAVRDRLSRAITSG